jgi:hypothetical protein
MRIAMMALVAVLSVIVVGVLTFYFKDYVRQVLALPVTRILWFLRLLIDSTPQLIFWGLLLFIFFVVVIRSLSAGNPPVVQMVGEPLQSPRRQRIAFWTNQFAQTLSGDQYSKIRLEGYLGDIAMQVLAHQYKEDPEKIRLLILQDKLELPPEIKAFVKARYRPVLETRPGFWASIWSGFQKWFSFFKNRLKQPMILSPGQSPGDEIEAVIHYLEEQLEVRDDSRD